MGERRAILWGYGSLLGVTAIAVVTAIAAGGRLILSVPPFAVFAITIALFGLLFRPLQLVAIRHPAPLRQLRDDLTNNREWFTGAAVMLVALPLLFDATTRIKQMIPQLQPFYADPFLIDLDNFLFAGHDPWQLTHAVLGEWSTYLIDYVYAGWLFIQVAMTVFLVLVPRRDIKVRVGLSLQLAWLLMGAGLAVAFASVGPCFVDDFYGSQRFAPLMLRLEEYDGLLATNAMNYLLSVQGQAAVGGGISAMPSLHVGIAVLILLSIRTYWPRWQAVGWVYVASIYVGSIHLGWHYATDGMVSGLGMVLIWKAVNRYCDWIERRCNVLESQPISAAQ